MAKNNNLKDFITDIANAIREKKGTTEKINPQNFSDEIRGIESGIAPCEWNDVNFYDYEGTILHSYTWDEFVEKNEMPPLPTHREKEGLICQEWNYTLEEVLEQGGRCDVGATYITDNNRTRLILNITSPEFQEISITCGSNSGVNIYWGDGNIDETDDTTNIVYTHKYNNIGVYSMEIESKNNDFLRFSINNGTSSYFIESIHFGNNVSLLNIALSNLVINKVSLSKGLKLSTQVFISCGVTHITLPRDCSYGIHVLQGAYSLITVSLPNTTTNFHDNYFFAVSTLKYLHVPSKVNKAITTWANYIAKNLKKITVSKANPIFYEENNCMIETSTKRLVKGCFNSIIPSDIENLDTCCFGYSRITSIKLPVNLNKISNQAFYYCTNLEKITIPSNVAEMGSSVFYEDTKLNTVNILSQYITSLGTQTFYNCSALSSINLPENIAIIGQQCFQNCTSLIDVRIPKKISTINTYAFYHCTKLTLVDFRKAELVPALSNTNAFASISSTSKFVVPNALYDEWTIATNWVTYANKIIKADNTIIYESSDNTAITPNTDTDFGASIETNTCSNNIGFTIFDNPITAIPRQAYLAKSNLTSIIIPDGVENIGEKAFYACTNLKNIEIGKGVTSVGNQWWFSCPNIESITVSEDNTVFDSRDNCNAFIETATNKLKMGCKNTIIPNTVEKLGGSAFEGCTGLTSITFPESLYDIGGYAFRECDGLTNITIPATITSIGENAFLNCSNLKYAICESINPPTLGSNVFNNVHVDFTIYVPDDAVNTYKSATNWCVYADYIRPISDLTIDF